jgi:glycerol-1-phosphate dehydrogenase [NAD(P)+]
MGGERPQAVTVDDRATEHLIRFCGERGLDRLLLVMDRNTRAALGEQVEAALQAAGKDVVSVVFGDAEVVADANHIFDVLLVAGRVPRTYIAIGSGTITDITRFVSHRTGASFISMPTAPSVDGFASIGAPLIIGGVKETVICHAPVAIFADVTTLTKAPKALIAAGFGDMLGKYTSVADWRLGRLLWGEPYDDEIAQRTLAAVQYCVDRVDAISEASPDGVRGLLEALIESGYCMLDFGTSRPASGAEHHYSHFWEMKLLREGRPAILHGAKVGVATTLVAELYAQVRRLSHAQVSDLLEASSLRERAAEVKQIEQTYGTQADEVMRAHRAFLDMSEATYDALKQRILAKWDEIQLIAAEVPPAETIADLLARVGGPITVADLGLTADEQALAEQNSHYLRNRFTVRKLMNVLNSQALNP